MQYSFQAGLLRIEADKKRAVFYLMNTSRNRNRWGITDKSLEEGLPSIMGKPISCGAGYKLGHTKNQINVGKFVDYAKPDSYALGIAEITDDKVLAKLQAGEWGPISVVVEAYASSCSICGEDITEEGYEHDHIKNGPGYIVVDSFVFQRVDFVEDSAYPQAGLQEILAEVERAAEQPITLLAGYYEGPRLEAGAVSYQDCAKAPEARPWDVGRAEASIRRWAGGPDKDTIDWAKYRRAFAWYDSGDAENFASYKLLHHELINGEFSVVWRGVAAAMGALLGARGGVDIPAGDKKSVYNHLRRHYDQYEKEAPEYHASQSTADRAMGSGAPTTGGSKPNQENNTDMTKTVEELQAELNTAGDKISKLEADLAAANTKTSDVAKLQAELDALKDERHQAMVEATAEARYQAGLATDLKAEKERLKTFAADILRMLKEDAGKVKGKLEAQKQTAPKTEYGKEDGDELTAAVAKRKQELGIPAEVK